MFFAFIPVCNIDIFLEHFYLFQIMPLKITTVEIDQKNIYLSKNVYLDIFELFS